MSEPFKPQIHNGENMAMFCHFEQVIHQMSEGGRSTSSPRGMKPSHMQEESCLIWDFEVKLQPWPLWHFYSPYPYPGYNCDITNIAGILPVLIGVAYIEIVTRLFLHSKKWTGTLLGHTSLTMVIHDLYISVSCHILTYSTYIFASTLADSKHDRLQPVTATENRGRHLFSALPWTFAWPQEPVIIRKRMQPTKINQSCGIHWAYVCLDWFGPKLGSTQFKAGNLFFNMFNLLKHNRRNKEVF